MDAGRKLEFCRGLARRHFPPSPAAPTPVVYRQYRLSPRAPCEPSDPELPARGVPQRRCLVSIGFNASYVQQVLGVIPEGTDAVLGLSDEVSPGVISTDADSKFTYVVMPMRL